MSTKCCCCFPRLWNNPQKFAYFLKMRVRLRTVIHLRRNIRTRNFNLKVAVKTFYCFFSQCSSWKWVDRAADSTRKASKGYFYRTITLIKSKSTRTRAIHTLTIKTCVCLNTLCNISFYSLMLTHDNSTFSYPQHKLLI